MASTYLSSASRPTGSSAHNRPGSILAYPCAIRLRTAATGGEFAGMLGCDDMVACEQVKGLGVGTRQAPTLVSGEVDLGGPEGDAGYPSGDDWRTNGEPMIRLR